MKPIEISQSKYTTGYLLLSAIAVMAYTLALGDTTMLVFAIPVVLVFALGASKDKGSVDADLEQVGWTSKNTQLAIPLGIIGGFAGLLLGGLVIQFTPQNVASIVPDMSSISKLTTASVIPPFLAVGFNIFSQWAIITPSEESLSKILAPFAGMSFAKNLMIAYVFGTFVWIAMHIPTFIMQGTPFSMYYVLVILGTITAGVYFITRNLLSSIIAHGTFNTGVLVVANGIDTTGFYILGTLVILLSIAYFRGGKK